MTTENLQAGTAPRSALGAPLRPPVPLAVNSQLHGGPLDLFCLLMHPDSRQQTVSGTWWVLKTAVR